MHLAEPKSNGLDSNINQSSLTAVSRNYVRIRATSGMGSRLQQHSCQRLLLLVTVCFATPFMSLRTDSSLMDMPDLN